MHRNDSANEGGGGSSPETVIARSSSEDDPRRITAASNRESSSSLETPSSGVLASSAGQLLAAQEKRKKSRFGSLKSSFRKDGGLFKLKKNKNKNVDVETAVEAEPEPEEEKATSVSELQRQRSTATAAAAAEDEIEIADDPTIQVKKAKKKKPSLVRRLSLNKLRSSSTTTTEHHLHHNQELLRRSTPEGGDGLQQEEYRIKGEEAAVEAAVQVAAAATEKGAQRKSDKRAAGKPPSTVTVVQRNSPSLTIRSSGKRNLQLHEPEERVSTLPYAISKWPEAGEEHQQQQQHQQRLKSQEDLHRKLSLLEEKRALFQRSHVNSGTQDNVTVIAVTIDEESPATTKREPSVQSATSSSKKTARHNISVRKFDTFSTFEGTFDEDAGVGYLDNIKEDFAESYERRSQEEIWLKDNNNMGQPNVNDDNAEKSRSASQDSVSSQNNTINASVGEKREHLYKILVIGELGAGKTSIIKRYVHQFFSQHYRATIGVDFALKVLNWDPHTIIRLQLWDIAGQERFGNMTRVYYKEAVGAFIVFDVTRSATLDAVVKWKQDLDSKVQLLDGTPIPCVLLANKCDQQKEGMVNSHSKMDEYIKEKNFAGWFETSAKENINIEEAAKFLVNKILQNDQLMKGNSSQDQVDGERFALNQPSSNNKKSCSC